MMKKITVYFRLEGSKRIGYGHLMRTMVLAEELRRKKYKIIFLCNNDNFLLLNLKKKRFQYKILKSNAGSDSDIKEVIKIIKKNKNNIFIYDNYEIDHNYEKIIKPFTKLLVAIDDEAKRRFFADIIINQNYASEKYKYELLNKYTSIIAGSKYVLLRDEFSRNIKRKNNKKVKDILLTFGGSDTAGMTIRMLRLLKNYAENENINLNCVINKNFKNIRSIRNESRGIKNIELFYNIKNMAKLMERMDIAISASGSTVWELLYIGVPSILVITAENQKKIAENLAKDGYVYNIGWFDKIKNKAVLNTVQTLINDQKKRAEFSKKGKKLIDGKGRERIESIITSYVS